MKVGIVAGEASGDLLGAHLVHALSSRVPGIEFIGIGGPKMQAAGVDSLFPMEKLAVRGYVEVLRHYREIVNIRRKLLQYFVNNPPDVFIGVDAPDFNLELETGLKKRGIPTIHYVSPSIWAWRGERIHKIARAVSHVLVLFPFEKKIYDAAGIPATYVGHPLADILPEQPNRKAAREQLRLPQSGKVIAMLPGSRQSELHYMANLFVRTAQRIVAGNPDVHFLVPLVSRESRNLFETELHKAAGGDLPLTVLFGHAHVAMTAADAVLVASGTATLEAALLKCPMVITYKMSPLTWHMMRRKKYQAYVGLPNILEGRFIVPELLQDDATPENLSQAVVNLVNDEPVKGRLAQVFSRLHHDLKQNTADRAAGAILPFLR
ncbi:MAG: lipid-A-disaccharide synthase [Sulfuricella sp.]|nr:lipid-A-disaccharide synthase [Gammaproteobacteria bacterium]